MTDARSFDNHSKYFDIALLVPNGTRVLDIGCGCGGLGLALKERFELTGYTGVEISRKAAKMARKMNAGANIITGLLSSYWGTVCDSLNAVLAEPILEIISVLRHFRIGEEESHDCDVECETILDGSHGKIWELWWWCKIEC